MGVHWFSESPSFCLNLLWCLLIWYLVFPRCTRTVGPITDAKFLGLSKFSSIFIWPTWHKHLFLVQIQHIKYGKLSLGYEANIWNKLSPTTKRVSSLDDFKKSIKMWKGLLCKCSSCKIWCALLPSRCKVLPDDFMYNVYTHYIHSQRCRHISHCISPLLHGSKHVFLRLLLFQHPCKIKCILP